MFDRLRQWYRVATFRKDPTKGSRVEINSELARKLMGDPYTVFGRPYDPVSGLRPEITEWLNTRIHWISPFHYGGFGELYFLEELDALEFKLIFCGA